MYCFGRYDEVFDEDRQRVRAVVIYEEEEKSTIITQKVKGTVITQKVKGTVITQKVKRYGNYPKGKKVR